MTPPDSAFHDFEIFEGCFGNTRVMPTDIDCMVERNGKFLLIEFKTAGVNVPMGQAIMLKRLARKPGFTVAVVWHEPCVLHGHKTPTAMQVLPSGDKLYAGEAEVRTFVSDWWRMVNHKP